MVAATLCLASPAVSADQAPRPATTYKAPRAADGHPDLEGVWSNAAITRLERNPRHSDTLVLTEAQVRKIESRNQALIDLGNKPTDPNAKVTDLPADCSDGRGTNCNYNAAWTDPGSVVSRVAGQGRNGFITIPTDGRVPMRKDVKPSDLAGRVLPKGWSPSDNPESRALGERCLIAFGTSSGPVMSPGLYNNTYQFVQTRDQIAIVVEMVHDTRIVRLGARHLPATIRPWMGDSIGWWEGDTLVVETVNYHPEQSFRGASANLKVTERFTPVGPGRMHYGFWGPRGGSHRGQDSAHQHRSAGSTGRRGRRGRLTDCPAREIACGARVFGFPTGRHVMKSFQQSVRGRVRDEAADMGGWTGAGLECAAVGSGRDSLRGPQGDCATPR